MVNGRVILSPLSTAPCQVCNCLFRAWSLQTIIGESIPDLWNQQQARPEYKKARSSYVQHVRTCKVYRARLDELNEIAKRQPDHLPLDDEIDEFDMPVIYNLLAETMKKYNA